MPVNSSDVRCRDMTLHVYISSSSFFSFTGMYAQDLFLRQTVRTESAKPFTCEITKSEAIKRNVNNPTLPDYSHIGKSGQLHLKNICVCS